MSTNHVCEFKLLDTLMFILKTPELSQLKEMCAQ